MMNSFLLLFVSLWLGQPTTCFRLFMAAGAGSAYCCGWTLITAEVVDVPAFGLSGLGVFFTKYCKYDHFLRSYVYADDISCIWHT